MDEVRAESCHATLQRPDLGHCCVRICDQRLLFVPERTANSDRTSDYVDISPAWNLGFQTIVGRSISSAACQLDVFIGIDHRRKGSDARLTARSDSYYGRRNPNFLYPYSEAPMTRGADFFATALEDAGGCPAVLGLGQSSDGPL